MRSRVMVILKIARQHAAHMTLAQDNDVIQAFTADRTDQSLDIRILPGRSRRGDDLSKWCDPAGEHMETSGVDPNKCPYPIEAAGSAIRLSLLASPSCRDCI